MYDILVQYHGMLIDGVTTTLTVSLCAIWLGMLAGLCLAFGLLSRNAWIKRLSGFYRSIWRGTPILIQLLVAVELPPLLGLNVSPLVPAIAALALNTAAFQGEIYRAGLVAIPAGQIEAARMLGLTTAAIRLRILIPQMFRLTMPSLVNEIINIVKNSSLISVIAVTDLMRVGQQISANTFRPMDSYLAVGVLYLIINLGLAAVGVVAERHFSRGLTTRSGS